jgi:prefoldin subunit 5
MQAAEVQSNFNKSIIEGYKVEVDAFGQLIAARKTEFDAYDSQIKGEATKVGMYEAQARAFGETVRAYESEANIKLKWVDSELATIRASIEKYQAMIARDRESAANALAVTQAAAQAFTAEVNRYKSEIDGVNDTRRVELSIAEARLRNLLAYYETQVREYDQGQERMMKRIQILEQAIESAGKIAASLATGAMSAIHVAANMHGNATVEDRQSYSVQINRQGADVA